MKTLLTTAALLSALHAHALDQDKQAHIAASTVLGAAVTAATPDWTPAQQWRATMAVALMKEIYDSQQRGNHFSVGDLAANAIGATLGVNGWRVFVKREMIIFTIAF